MSGPQWPALALALLTSVLEKAPPNPLQNHPVVREHPLTAVSKKHNHQQWSDSCSECLQVTGVTVTALGRHCGAGAAEMGQ